ncbi:ABC transporter substrate-binding protein [Chachezhania sediminis]|uniref:ABC transporter substrate-binding protein n=1 Tax=Chachezhania sediminis TaxID=2599291 RepID=UPI00131AEBBA|nr:ABC transporter substrate-binding protein [Chachezhania sediminis]
MFLKIAAGAALASATLAVPATAGSTRYPLTIHNCGIDLTFDKAPETVVSLGQRGTEMLYLLGLADKVVGTAVWRSPVLPQFAEANARVERLADNDPSFEAVIARKPDFVTADLQFHIGQKGVVGTQAQFAKVGIPAYNLPSDCADRPKMQTSDGPRPIPFEMDLIYNDITELALIFDIPDRGAELVAELQAREEAALARIADVDLNGVSIVFWFSSATKEADPYVAGRNGTPGYMMRQLGLTNIIDSTEDWPTVGWETIARANPTFIVIGDMTRRRYPMDSTEAKMEFLHTDPVASLMDAVQQNRVIAMDVMPMGGSTRVIDGLETLADALTSMNAGQ